MWVSLGFSIARLLLASSCNTRAVGENPWDGWIFCPQISGFDPWLQCLCLWQAVMAPVTILLHLHLLRASHNRRSGCTSPWPSSARGSTSSPGTRCRRATTASEQSCWCTASTPAPPQGWWRHGAASSPQWIRRTWKKAGRSSPSFIILQLNSLRLHLCVTLYNFTAITSPFFFDWELYLWRWAHLSVSRCELG